MVNNHHQHTECKIDPCFITDETIAQQGSEVKCHPSVLVFTDRSELNCE